MSVSAEGNELLPNNGDINDKIKINDNDLDNVKDQNLNSGNL